MIPHVNALTVPHETDVDPTNDDPFAGYELQDLKWEIEPYPGGEPIIKRGTIDKVHRELLAENATLAARFLPPATLSTLEKRQDGALPPFDQDCNSLTTPPEGWAGAPSAKFFWPGSPVCVGTNGSAYAACLGMRHIWGLGTDAGKPINDPRQCGRLTCTDNTAIWWCNRVRVKRKSFISVVTGPGQWPFPLPRVDL